MIAEMSAVIFVEASDERFRKNRKKCNKSRVNSEYQAYWSKGVKENRQSVLITAR